MRKLFARCCAVVAMLVAATVPVHAGPNDGPAADCVAEFGSHLLGLQALIGDAMGQALDCERPLGAGGDSVQTTTTGTAWYTGDTSAAIFANGYQRWELDPSGLTYWSSPQASPLLLDGLPDGPAVWNKTVRCPVLYTHEVPVLPAFQRFLVGLMAAGYQPLSFAQVDAAMAGQGDLPPGCIVLSFDDALESQLRNAVPVLTELGITALFFVMPAFQDGRHRYLSATGLRALHDSGQLIGAHTCNHPTLTLLAALPMIAELSDCRHLVENIIGVPVRYFAYPNGAFNQVVLDATLQAGYRAAFTTRASSTLRPNQVLQLPRIRYDPGEAASAVVARIRAAP